MQPTAAHKQKKKNNVKKHGDVEKKKKQQNPQQKTFIALVSGAGGEKCRCCDFAEKTVLRAAHLLHKHTTV